MAGKCIHRRKVERRAALGDDSLHHHHLRPGLRQKLARGDVPFLGRQVLSGVAPYGRPC